MEKMDAWYLDINRIGYEDAFELQKKLVDARSKDEIKDTFILLEHEPVFTANRDVTFNNIVVPKEVLEQQGVEVCKTDRGGDVTYHGPGQLVLYCLLDLNRLGLGVRGFVTHIELSIIELLSRYNVKAIARKNSPGVYVNAAKIAALGLRIRKGCCYHGLSLNIDMDLGPFSRINPCGLKGQAVTQMVDLNISIGLDQAGQELTDILIGNISRG